MPPRTHAHVVIIGAGFGGLEAAKALGRDGIAVTVIDRRNHHLFQPLLYQVATAALSAPDVAEPIRKILRRYPSIQVLFGEVDRVDPVRRVIALSGGTEIGFDYLILASGASLSYFGHSEWASLAPGLKTIEDARTIRSRLLLSFEQAERETDPVEQQRLTSIFIIGGGPTGVELAGSVAELCRYTLARDFRNISPAAARIVLIEAAPRLLAAFSETASDYAKARLERLGVTVRLRTAVEDITATSITIAGESLPAGMVIWAAGVKPSPLARDLGAAVDRSGRVMVDSTLAVPGLPGVFAIGDAAHCKDPDGSPLPGLAQVAKQQGFHLGRELGLHLQDGTSLAPFRYASRGNAAIVGRHAAVFEKGRRTISGTLAWLGWAFVHVYLLVGFQHRMLVSLQWLWRYLTYERGARLITEDQAVERGTATQPRQQG
nr:NAD(P)/FAD-dependent oxidoreductase [Mangrovicella endophytica]